MNCRMTRGVYLRADGTINCYCSTGELIDLAKVPLDSQDFDFIKDIYWNKHFRHIRESFKKDCLPFPDICIKCKYLDFYGSYEEEKAEKEIKWFHIEPAAVCNLACPFCVHGKKSKDEDRSKSKPVILPRSVFKKIVEDISKHNYSVKWGYFQGRGEPGLNPKLWKMVKDIKKSCKTNFLVGTNGNIPFSEDIILSGLDSLKIAIDSIIPEVYSQYRINGDVNKIFELTEKVVDFKKHLKIKKPVIIWQKVLFNYNDSDDELIEYQKKAIELGVDKIRLVYTFTKDFSERKTKDFPKIFPNIEIYDAKEEDNITINHIIEKFKKAHGKKKPEFYIDVLSNIIHSRELGISNRKILDKRAMMKISNISLLKDENGNMCDKKLIYVYQKCLAKLSTAYKELGLDEEAEKYERYNLAFKKQIETNT